MSEWASVLIVFWVVWALDGVRVGRQRTFAMVGGVCARGRGVRVGFSRLSMPGVSPAAWRATLPDVPLTLSPIGVSNRPAGSAGRPAEGPALAQAWRWEEVREVGVARGAIYINGVHFC